MKVRRVMLRAHLGEHSNNYAEETTQFRHERILHFGNARDYFCVRHRGRTASCPNRPRTDPGVPFFSTLCARAHNMRYVATEKMWRPACKDHTNNVVVNLDAT